MKKIAILIKRLTFTTLILGSILGKAQEWTSSGTSIFNLNSGYVAIGNTYPISLLDVAKLIPEPTISVRNLGAGGGATFRMCDIQSGADWKFKALSNGGFKIRDNAFALDVIIIEPNSAPNVIYVNSIGNLGIGTNAPQEKLSVNGNIKCKQVEVSLTGWSDFVFNEDYKLMPLAELDQFIMEHNHLPDVPSAEEVIAKGNNLGEMDAILLQKIEELTLYVIELKKENDQLKQLIVK